MDNDLSTGLQKQAVKASSRRYACDRCRAQKLRCNRELMDSGNGPCRRCARAKVICTLDGSVNLGATKDSGRQCHGMRNHTSGGRASQHQRVVSIVEEPIQSPQALENDRLSSQNITQDSAQIDSAPAHLHSGALLLASPLSPTRESQEMLNDYQFGIDSLDSEATVPEFVFEADHFLHGQPGLNDLSASPATQIFNENGEISTSNILGILPEEEFSRGGVPSDQFLSSSLRASLPVENIMPQTTLSNSLSEEDRRELCIQQLSDVNALLMKNLTRLTTCVVATTFIFTPADQTTADYLFKTIDGSSTQSTAIGDVFRSTSEFIRIVRDFRDSLLDLTPRAARDHVGGNDCAANTASESPTSTDKNSMEEALKRCNLLTPYQHRPQEQLNSLHQRAMIDSSSIYPSPPRLSITSTLTILTCYVCILKSFQSIFISLQAWLSIPASSPLHAQLAPVVAGVQINTFALDSNGDRAMQFKILLQTCEHMLDKMEKALQFDLRIDGDVYTIFADPAFCSMLQILLKQEGLKSDGDITGTSKLRNLLKTIRQDLN